MYIYCVVIGSLIYKLNLKCVLYRQEYEMRGMELSNKTRAELEARGARKRVEIEEDFR